MAHEPDATAINLRLRQKQIQRATNFDRLIDYLPAICLGFARLFNPGEVALDQKRRGSLFCQRDRFIKKFISIGFDVAEPVKEKDSGKTPPSFWLYQIRIDAFLRGIESCVIEVADADAILIS